MGHLVELHGGTLERFTGDGMVVFFNDPVPIPDPAQRAVAMALAMRAQAVDISAKWKKRGFDLGAGLGVALGYATLGAIGYEKRIDYGAIGTVTNLAARLCAEAAAGEILVSQRVHAEIDGNFRTESLGSLSIRGLARPQLAYRLLEARTREVR
jgi:class 3 adenylate cyclase